MEYIKGNLLIMRNIMNTELESKKMLAINLGLLDEGICEFEFTVTVPDWQAETIEFWLTKERHAHQHVIVNIPEQYRAKFIFSVAKRLIESAQKNEIEKIKWS